MALDSHEIYFMFLAAFLRWRLDAALSQVVTLRHLLKQVTMSTSDFKIYGKVLRESSHRIPQILHMVHMFLFVA